MSKKKKPITAAELMAQLNADKDFVAKRALEEEERQKRAAEWHEAEKPLVEELRKAGFEVGSAWDLVNTAVPYEKALPILLNHLQEAYPDRVREGIARALAVPQAKFGWSVLIDLYRNEKGRDAKDGLAVAIAAISDDELIEDVVSLARDARHGPSRVLLLRALRRSADPRARGALKELRTDPELKKEIEVILRRL